VKDLTRTFVALLLPEDWMDYLAGVSRTLAEGTSGFSWVKPENFHLTVRFLGDLGDSGVRRVCDTVTEAASPLDAPRARLGELGAFPDLQRPRVLWIGFAEGGRELETVGKSVNDALRKAGFGPPDKPFRPHLTVARVREGSRGLDRVSGTQLPPRPDAGFLDRIVVMKSDLHPSGSRYTALTEARLRTPDGNAPTPPRTGSS
jgi:RNA 2',3'-cyclic 3'-phosphodiesterase